MKAKNALDSEVKIMGYVMDIDRADETQITVGVGTRYGSDYVVPDDYVCLTCNDELGREFYVILPKDTRVGADK